MGGYGRHHIYDLGPCANIHAVSQPSMMSTSLNQLMNHQLIHVQGLISLAVFAKPCLGQAWEPIVTQGHHPPPSQMGIFSALLGAQHQLLVPSQTRGGCRMIVQPDCLQHVQH